MLSGCSPFQEDTAKQTYTRIVSGKVRWPPNPSKYFNQDADDLICSLLVLDPLKRLGVTSDKEIRNHKWFSKLNWQGIQERSIAPPISLSREGTRQKTHSIGLAYNNNSFKGSGDMTLRLNNKDLNPRIDSTDGISTEPELELSTSLDKASWDGSTNSDVAIDEILFKDF